MFISQGSLLDQTNLSQQTSALSGFCAHINAICFSMSPQSCSSTRVPTSCTSVKTCSLFSTGRGSTLRTPCRWRFSSPLLAREQTQNIIGCMIDFRGDYLSLLCTQTKSCLLCCLIVGFISLKQGAYYIYMALPIFDFQGAHISILVSLFTPIHRSWGASHW